VRALLDTHTFLWSNTDDSRLSNAVRQIIEDGANDIVFSAVSALEIAIKYVTGRLPIPEPPAQWVTRRLALQRLTLLPVEISHGLHVANLPRHHGDPFDRLLVAQAQIEGLVILTSDPAIARYDVETIW
jgi:PIN domain nuclease of toxin-antitoxin system